MKIQNHNEISPHRCRMTVIKRQKDKVLAKYTEKKEPLYTLGGNVNWCYDKKKKLQKFHKNLKIEPPCDPEVPLLGIYPKVLKTGY